MAQLPVAAPMAQPIPDFDQAIITARQHVIELQRESNAQDTAIVALTTRLTAVEARPVTPTPTPVVTITLTAAVEAALAPLFGAAQGSVVILRTIAGPDRLVQVV